MSDLPPDIVPVGAAKPATSLPKDLVPIPKDIVPVGQVPSFDTQLSPADETAFSAWKNQYAPKDSGADYDLRGAFKAGLMPDPATGHWPDTYKKPNHPTFSNQSMYATGPNAAKAGRWDGEKFIPPGSPETPSLASRADDLLSNHPLYGAVKNAVPPLVNTLVADPIRNLAADVVGAVRSPPISDEAREKFWQERDKSLEGTSALRLPETEAGQGISKVLGLPGQAIGGLAGAIGDVTGTRETLGPAAQIAGDVLPFAGGAAAAMRGRSVPGASAATPQAVAARSAGYKLPPEEISEHPSLTSRLLAGESGKYKRQQAFSQDNQRNTNSLAARAIGLPPETALSPAAFERARKPAIAAYDRIKTEAPDTLLGADPAFQKAAQGVGVRNELVEKHFPEAVNNPKVAELRETLLQNATAPTDAVVKKIADLRSDAARNFKKRDDAQAHALGFAQRQAAGVLEDQIERSLGMGTDRVTVFGKVHDAMREVEKARSVLGGANVQSMGMPAAQAALAAAKAELAALPPVTAAEVAQAGALRKQFQDARQLFAKTYDVENATNLATGDVVARRVAALRSGIKHPLQGELKQIADAADAFPRNMQAPAGFGHLEDFSILDILGGAAAVGAGHPLAGAVVAGRHPARNLLRTEGMQNRMFNPPRYGANPATAVPAATLSAPHDAGVDPDDGLARAFQ